MNFVEYAFFVGRAALQLIPYLGVVATHGSRESENKVKKQTGPIVIPLYQQLFSTV